MTAENHSNTQRPVYNKAQAKLIQATLDSLMQEGIDGCSVRKICERAGTAVGLINYHFGTLNDLLAAAYLDLAYTLMDQAIKKSHKTELPRQQLSFFIHETFGDAVLQRKILRAWVVFWSMIDRAPQIKIAHDISNQAFRVFLEQSFMALNNLQPVKPSPRLAAIGLTAIIDGLWLEWCLSSDSFNSSEFNATEAILLCEQWVDGACNH